MRQIDQQRVLGASGLQVSALGVGTNRWGAPAGKDEASLFPVFQAALDAGLTFFDTAEIYNGGASERMLGACMARDTRPVIIASKFAPLPNRVSPHTLMDALDASLERLNLETLDLYYIHWPYALMRLDALMDMLALAVRIGKVRAVGVSNFSARQMRQAATRLARYNIPLASNEVHYSLLNRQPEVDGVLEACRELNVALIAYRPLARGLLKAHEPGTQDGSELNRQGPLAFLQKRARGRQQEALERLHQVLAEISQAHEKTVSQVALRWLLQRDEHIIPIPGSTSVAHIEENIGTLNWQLSADEFAQIDQASASWKK